MYTVSPVEILIYLDRLRQRENLNVDERALHFVLRISILD